MYYTINLCVGRAMGMKIKLRRGSEPDLRGSSRVRRYSLCNPQPSHLTLLRLYESTCKGVCTWQDTLTLGSMLVVQITPHGRVWVLGAGGGMRGIPIFTNSAQAISYRMKAFVVFGGRDSVSV
jgi:hypothetical protein